MTFIWRVDFILAERRVVNFNSGEITVYYSTAVRYAITASSQKINYYQDERQLIIAVHSTNTVIAGTPIE